jgi:hypothetical protein|tara:strand:- start:441 stop:554 length:114 start_codon:yes stop_codon:yes gene_type:complete
LHGSINGTEIKVFHIADGFKDKTAVLERGVDDEEMRD